MLKGDTIPGVLFVAFGVLFLIPSANMGIVSETSDGVPGPGFFPAIISSIIIILGLILLIKGLKNNGKYRYFIISEDIRNNMKPFFMTLAGMVLFLAALKLFFFFAVSYAFLIYLNWVFKRSLKFNIIFSTVFIVAIYVVFKELLRVQFVM